MTKRKNKRTEKSSKNCQTRKKKITNRKEVGE